MAFSRQNQTGHTGRRGQNVSRFSLAAGGFVVAAVVFGLWWQARQATLARDAMARDLQTIEQQIRDVELHLADVEEAVKELDTETGLDTWRVQAQAGLEAANEDPQREAALSGPVLANRPREANDEPFRRLSPIERMNAVVNRMEHTASDLEHVQLAVGLRKEVLSTVPTRMPTYGRVTSGFGWRPSPFGGPRVMHQGMDFAAPEGTPILAGADGVVRFSGWRRGFGKVVEIDHAYNLMTRYAHASRLLVKKGARVTQGQEIAEIGSTGRSTGPHLHYEIWVRGRVTNPEAFLLDRPEFQRVAAESGDWQEAPPMHGAAEGDLVEAAGTSPGSKPKSDGTISLAAKPLKIATTPEELIPGEGALSPQSFVNSNSPNRGRSVYQQRAYSGLLDIAMAVGVTSLILLLLGGFYLLRAHREKS